MNSCTSPLSSLDNGYTFPFLYYDSNPLELEFRKKPCIRVNTREINGELCTGLSILYTPD